MKKLLIFLIFIIETGNLFSQSRPVITVPRASVNNTVQDPALYIIYNFGLPRYTDTVSANVQKAADSCGTMIYTYLNNAVYYRGCSPKRWIAFGSSSGGGTITNLTSGLTLIGATGYLGGDLARNTSVSGVNLYSQDFDSLTSFRVNALGGSANSGFRLSNDGTVELSGGTARLRYLGDTIISDTRAGYASNLNATLTENSWITKGYFDSLNTGGISAAINGLNLSGSTARWGGPLLFDTRISAGNFSVIYDSLGKDTRFLQKPNSSASVNRTIDFVNGNGTDSVWIKLMGRTSGATLRQGEFGITSTNDNTTMLFKNVGGTFTYFNVINAAHQNSTYFQIDSIVLSLNKANATAGKQTYLNLYNDSTIWWAGVNRGAEILLTDGHQDQFADDSLIWRSSNRATQIKLFPDSMSLYQTGGEYYVYNMQRAASATGYNVMVYDTAASEWKHLPIAQIVGATPTWESVLNSTGGSTLLTSHTITGGSTEVLTFEHLTNINLLADDDNGDQQTFLRITGSFDENAGIYLGMQKGGDSSFIRIDHDDVYIQNGDNGYLRFNALAGSHNASDSMLVINSTTKIVGYRPIPSAGSGTVTSVATGLGLSGGTITTTGTIIADTTVLLDKLVGTNITGAMNFTSVVTGTGFAPTATTATGNRLYLPASNTLGLAINGTGEVQLTASALAPITNGGNDLGTSSLLWASSYVSGTGQFGSGGRIMNLADQSGTIGEIPAGRAIQSNSSANMNLIASGDAGTSGVKIGLYGYTGSAWKSVLEFANGASLDLLLNKSGFGKVGIGTSSPTEALTVNGQIKVFAPQAGDVDSIGTWKNGILSATLNSALTGLPYIPLTGTGTLTGAVTVAMATNTINFSNGMVGIGTTPSVALDVVGGVNFSFAGANASWQGVSDFQVTGVTNYFDGLFQLGDASGSFGLGDYQGDVNFTSINGDDLAATIIYRANNGHTFSTGIVTISNLSAGGDVYADAGTGTLIISSDPKLKNIHGRYNSGLDIINRVNPISYNWNVLSGYNMNHTMIGFNAAEIKDVIPEAVGSGEKGLSLDTRPLLAANINATKELYQMILDLQREIEQLKSQRK